MGRKPLNMTPEEKRARHLEQMRTWKDRHPKEYADYKIHWDKQRASQLQRVVNSKAECLKAQEGACALCGRDIRETPKAKLVKFKNLVCPFCCRGINAFRGNTEVLRKAADLLE